MEKLRKRLKPIMCCEEETIMVRLYHLDSDVDKPLAMVMEFEEKTVVVKWIGDIGSIVIHNCLADFMQISLTNGRKLVKANVTVEE